MNRTRNTGSVHLEKYTLRRDVYRSRLASVNGKLVPQYDTLTYSIVLNPTVDDRQSMNDYTGCYGAYNPIHHVCNRPASVNATGARWVPSNPPVPNWFDWRVYGADNGKFGGQLSFQGLLSGSPGPLPMPGFTSPDWSALVYQVGSQLDGHMTTGQNLFVDLAQIGQTIAMFRHPFRLSELPSIMRHRPLGRLMKYSANGFLEYKFGWKPIWEDICAIARVFSEVRQHQAYLQAAENRFVSLSARQTNRSNPPSCTFNVFGTQDYVRIYPMLDHCEQTACVSLDARFPASARVLSTMDQVLARLGARDIASALWDLVPYSFVVDWFTHVGNYIEQKPIDWCQYELRRIGRSVKTTWFGKFHVTSQVVVDGIVRSNVDYYTDPFVVQTQYDRYAGLPSGTSSVGLFGNLNKTQIAEGLALIVQRL